MPRIARVVVPDFPHHITQRGNYRQKVFSGKEDYLRYLGWLGEYLIEYQLSVLAFCLMPNHVHFAAIPHKDNSLAKTFNTCHMRYSQYYNKRQKATGHLWQGRFYSCPLDEAHLYETVRYIENNPVRSNLVEDAGQWSFSSAGYRLGRGKSNLPLVDIKKYLEIPDWKKYLNERGEQAIIEKVKANTLTGRPSGSDAFVARLEKKFGIRLKPLCEGRPRKRK